MASRTHCLRIGSTEKAIASVGKKLWLWVSKGSVCEIAVLSEVLLVLRYVRIKTKTTNELQLSMQLLVIICKNTACPVS